MIGAVLFEVSLCSSFLQFVANSGCLSCQPGPPVGEIDLTKAHRTAMSAIVKTPTNEKSLPTSLAFAKAFMASTIRRFCDSGNPFTVAPLGLIPLSLPEHQHKCIERHSLKVKI